ncbi:MAG: hypothetical protein IPG60_01615 [Bacteroidetes bacterium]|nr:hypothetical protein [Bacteroidota bacterium]
MIEYSFCTMIIESLDFDLENLPINHGLEILLKSEKGQILESKNDFITSEVPTLILQGGLNNMALFIESIIHMKIPLSIVKNLSYTVEFSDQCNFEIDTSDLKVFSKLDVPLGITCYTTSS